MKLMNSCVLVACGRDGFPESASRVSISDDVAEICRSTASFYRTAGYTPPWISYLLCFQGEVVGGGAFVGSPRNGEVEIAYFTLPQHEGKGFARVTATKLRDIATEADPRLFLYAKTLPDENASTAILRSLGFRRLGDVTDEDIGAAWAWSLAPKGEPAR